MRLLLLLFISLSLFGRDNPFFPADPNEKQIQTTNKVEILKPFSTQFISLPSSARVVKSIVISYQNLDGFIEQERLDLNFKIDWHKPIIVSHKSLIEKPKPKKPKKNIINMKFISFDISDKKMKIRTKDKLLQNFLLVAPHRVVMDFKRDIAFKPKTIKVNKPPFSKIRMGHHDRYYRVVIELDGQYRYKLLTTEKDYTIVCY